MLWKEGSSSPSNDVIRFSNGDWTIRGARPAFTPFSVAFSLVRRAITPAHTSAHALWRSDGGRLNVDGPRNFLRAHIIYYTENRIYDTDECCTIFTIASGGPVNNFI